MITVCSKCAEEFPFLVLEKDEMITLCDICYQIDGDIRGKRVRHSKSIKWSYSNYPPFLLRFATLCRENGIEV